MPDKTSAIPAPAPQMTQWQARRSLGWVSTIDFVFMAVIVASLAGVSVWCTFGWPSNVQLVLVALGMILVMLVWIVLLLYRAMLYTLELRADVNVLPFEAARIAVGHITGSNGKSDEQQQKS